MERNIGVKICFGLFVIGLLFSQTEALSCYQCNVFIRGTPWPCDSERGMKKVDGCVSCLKTFTRSYLHNTFHDDLYTSYESRLCVKSKDYSKEAGCHPHETDSGYMKRCFCYTDFCNGAQHTSLPVTLMFLCTLSGWFMKRML